MGDEHISADYTDDLRRLMGFLVQAGDREAVIVVAAYCENWIDDVIKSRLPGLTRTLTKELFGTSRPLGTANAKYDIAFAMGAITNTLYDDLKNIAKIRNRFAHNLAVSRLSNVKVAGLVDNLTLGKDIIHNRDIEVPGRRGHFNQAALRSCVELHNAVNEAVKFR